MKEIMTEADNRIKVSEKINSGLYVNHDFAVEIMKNTGKNILNNMNLLLFLYINQRNETVEEILISVEEFGNTLPTSKPTFLSKLLKLLNLPILQEKVIF
jgi:hypothetical protein